MAFTSTPFLCTSISSTSSTRVQVIFAMNEMEQENKLTKTQQHIHTITVTHSLTHNTLNSNIFFVHRINFIWILKGGIFVHIYYYLPNNKMTYSFDILKWESFSLLFSYIGRR